MLIATIFHTHTPGWVEVVTTYDQNYIDDLKASISSEDRRWVPETKSWRIRVNRLGILRVLLHNYGFTVSDEELDISDGANIFQNIFRIIPGEYRSKVYFALAQALHPDHGGTNEQMKELNQAFDETKNA